MTTGEIINELRELEFVLWEQALKADDRRMGHAYSLSSDKVTALIQRIEDSFNNYYFTFGSWEGFPYQNTYLIVKANSVEEAVKKFEEKFPNENGTSVLCAFYYTEEDWKEQDVGRYYRKPAEIIY